MAITKWIFAGLGWAIGGPIGAILGYYLGKAISHDTQLNDGRNFTSGGSHHGPYRNTGTQQDLNAALIVLIAAVMKADGDVKKSELEYVKRFLRTNYGDERGKELLHVLQQMVQNYRLLSTITIFVSPRKRSAQMDRPNAFVFVCSYCSFSGSYRFTPIPDNRVYHFPLCSWLSMT